MTELNPVRCDRCDDLFYEPEETKYKWNVGNEEFDLCCLCNDILVNYFYYGHLTKLTLSCNGIMEHEKSFVDEQKEMLKEIGD